MRYAGFMPNDFLNGENVCVSLWMQGCPHKCKGCHNPETWDENAGYEIDINEIIERLKKAIVANNVMRNFSILGGEPLAPFNIENTSTIIKAIREEFPSIKIFLWTGYTYEYLENNMDKNIKDILNNIDTLIDGPYVESERNISLKLRGSSNQNIINLK